jgi:hypothetical protein
MHRHLRAIPIAVALSLAALNACSPAPQAPVASGPASNPKAAKDYAAYQQLVQAQSWELAQSIGRDLVKRYPGTLQAIEVAKTLPAVDAKANAITDQRRLLALWDYQISTASDGGKQSSASIYSSSPRGGSERLRLILRRHVSWGQSVYVFGSKPGYECASPCRIGVQFDDGAVEQLKGKIPETGEPAVFIEEDAAFLARLPKAHKIAVTLKPKGKPAQTAVFETGGYDAAKFLPLPGK